MVSATRKPITIEIEAVLQQAEDKTLRTIAHYIAEELKDIPNQPTTMSVDKFAETEGLSRNFILEHKNEFCVHKIGGRVLINMVAWREKLKAAGRDD